MTYAAKTEVSVEKTRMELDTLLSKHGAQQRLMGTDDEAGVAFAAFTIAKRQVRLKVPLPKLEDVEKDRAAWPRGFYGRGHDQRRAWFRKELEQRQRSRWRALLLLVKAKLEAIALGVSTVEREFLADITLLDGRSVHETIAEDLERVYVAGGNLPPLLGSGS